MTIGQKFKVWPITYSASQTASITLAGQNLSYTFTKNNLTAFNTDEIEFVFLDMLGNPTTSKYIPTVSGSSLTLSYLPFGSFKPVFHSNTYGYAAVSYGPTGIINRNWQVYPTTTNITSSILGGEILTINGPGFQSDHIENNYVSFCGFRADVL